MLSKLNEGLQKILQVKIIYFKVLTVKVAYENIFVELDLLFDEKQCETKCTCVYLSSIASSLSDRLCMR